MDREQIRQINAQMVERLLAAPPKPVPDGGYALRVLETTGRSSGDARRVPIAVVGSGGRSYLVTPDPGRDWARNLDATDSCRLLADGLDQRETVTRLDAGSDADEAADAVLTYLRAMDMPQASAAFPVGRDDSLETVRAHLDSIAVFRLESSDDDIPAHTGAGGNHV